MGYSIETLFSRYPELNEIKESINQTFTIIKNAFSSGKKLFVCGNGGSASDAEHIVGELMKGFLLKRELPKNEQQKFIDMFGDVGKDIASKLQQGFPAIALTGHPSLSTAFNNDVDASLTFSQQLYSMAESNDVLLAISTSGNSDNVVKCLQTAKVLGVKTIILTGRDGGVAAKLADCAVIAPSNETYIIQEFHLPIYHALCAALEEEFYGK